MFRCQNHGREVRQVVERGTIAPSNIWNRVTRWFHEDDDTECDGLIETVPS